MLSFLVAHEKQENAPEEIVEDPLIKRKRLHVYFAAL